MRRDDGHDATQEKRSYEHLLLLYQRPFMKKTRLMFLQGCIVAQGYRNDGGHVACDNYISTPHPTPPVASNICWSSVWDLAACHFSAVKNYYVTPRFLANLCTPVVASRMGGPVDGTRRLMEHVVRPRVYLQHIKNDS